MKLNTKIMFVIVLILLITITLQTCNTIQKVKEKNQLLTELTTYKSDNLRYENNAVIQNSIIVNNKKDLQHYLDMLKNDSLLSEKMSKELKYYKNLASHTSVTTVTLIKNDTIYINDSIIDFGVMTIRKDTTNYKLHLTATNKYVSIDTLLIPNTQSFLIGERKTGFLNLNTEYAISIENTNPLIQTTNITSMQFKPTKKWYEKNWIYFVGGCVISGLTITYVLK